MLRYPGALALTICIVLSVHAPAGAQGFDYSGWGGLLERYRSTDGKMHYKALKAERAEALDPVTAAFEAVSPRSHPERFPKREDKIAYWLNAYNVLVIKGVIDSYPIESVLAVKMFHGFFRRVEHTVGGRTLTLWEIENEILRGRFGDPRIHFALNCASWDCPPLWPEPFVGPRLNEQLDAAARAFVGTAKHVRLSEDGNRLELSKIFDWYHEDFTTWMKAQSRGAEGIVGFVADYAPGELGARLRASLSQDLEIDYRDYDWRLNDALDQSGFGN